MKTSILPILQIILLITFSQSTASAQLSFEADEITAYADTTIADTVYFPDPFEFKMNLIEPVKLNYLNIAVAIGYPEQALSAGIDGKVKVRVLVDEEGQYLKHMVIDSPSPILTEAVEQHISEMTFRPGTENGQAVTAWTTIDFHFNLRN